MHLQIEHLLSPATPALLNLERLELVGLQLEEFSFPVGRALKCLTHLDLSSNSFDALPTGIAEILNLQILNLTCNESLTLFDSDVYILQSLPSLRSLHLAKNNSECNWSQGSVIALLGIMEAFPNLEMPGFRSL
jgi:Leucine-rich repeat (LRR) protein